MKKILLSIVIALIAVSAVAENSARLLEPGFPAGQVRIAASDRGHILRIPVCINSELAFDEFCFAVVCSDGVEFIDFEPGEWLYDVYFGEDGEPHTLEPLFEHGDCYVRCRTMTQGYEDGKCYGTVKWESGYRMRMCYISLLIKENFVGSTVRLQGYLSAGPDTRGGAFEGICDVLSESDICLGYADGDVNHDGKVTISDVTTLIDNLMR